MEIEKLYVYPIKSMRGVEVPSATLTKYGFPYDRRFMVLAKQEDNGAPTLKNITIAPNNELVRFWQSIDSSTSTLTVTFKPTDGGEAKSIDIPLEPDTADLKVIDVMMHKSPTQAYQMPDKFNTFLSSCLGYEVILAYIGDYKREVRMSNLGSKPNDTSTGSSWLTTLTTAASKATSMVTGTAEPSTIAFADVAPYLIVSSKSMDSVLARLPADQQNYSILKFRPNIIVSGASAVWEEDFWAQLTVGDSSSSKAKLECEHNCSRCRSINIDYDTGEQGKGEQGSMLKKLASDRRVDPGAKWSPIFGRYSFMSPGAEGEVVRVGDEVVVSRRNEERTAFDWKGLSTLPGGGRE
ncbi:uncharacterized protein LTR77_006256 [Saxophila tyrrhenica]|uniref:MOSC domain-containing protein n=1 Tax=Saxophila tyrrhenica TaxID=1690608 RepID=A0AAV9PBA4_9PEZI|nr:hypothetical protein LTR77_006256 [Saxophila tyrrhenica]